MAPWERQIRLVLPVLMTLLLNSPRGLAAPSSTTATTASKTTQATAVKSITVAKPAASPEPVTWDGTAAWNGARFESDYDSSASNCALGRVNTQYGALQAYLTGINVDSAARKVTSQGKVKYGHGLTSAYPYEYSSYQTHVLANDKYLRFWHGSRIMTASGCNASSAECDDTATVTLSTADERGKSIPASFFSGKSVSVILRGIDMSYGSSLNYVKKFQDAEFSVTLGQTVAPADGKLTVKLNTNFNGSNAAAYNATVYYTILVFDPAEVSVVTAGADSGAMTCDSAGKCAVTASQTISGSAWASSFSSADVTAGKIAPMFVALQEWGLDYSDPSELHRIRAGAKLHSWDPAARKAGVYAFGEAFHADCSATGNNEKSYKANEVTYRVISCRSIEVCQATYSSVTGEEEAWTQKIWNDIKEKFEEIKEEVAEAVAEGKELVRDVKEGLVDAADAISDAVSSLATGSGKTFPENEVLVVLKDGVSASFLDKTTSDAKIKSVYSAYGNPSVKQLYPYEGRQQMEGRIETEILQPYDVRWQLERLGFKGDLNVPPLHRFYVLTFPASVNENKRDDIIAALGTSSRVEQADENYVAKLESKPGDPYYSSSLLWFKPYAEQWWDLNDTLAAILFAAVDTENLYRGMELLYPEDAASTASRSRAVAPATYAFDPALEKDYYQFPGRPPIPRGICGDKTLLKKASRLRANAVTVASASKSKKSAKTQTTGKKMDLATLGAKKLPKTSFKPKKGALATASPCEPEEILIRYDAATTAGQRGDIESRHGLAQIAYLKLADAYYYLLPSGKDVEEALDELQDEESVRYAEPNMKHFLADSPNDTSYANQWNLNNANYPDSDIDAEGAWALFGSSQPGGNDIKVAVLDSGINYRHNDFFHNSSGYNDASMPAVHASLQDSNIWINETEWSCFFSACSGYDGDRNGYQLDTLGWNFTTYYRDTSGAVLSLGDADVTDLCGHGTLVSSVLGAVGNNGLGIAGVAWRAKIINVKTFDCVGDNSEIATSDGLAALAIDYAVSKGAKVVNLSWGHGEPNADSFGTMALKDTISGASSVLFVAAAGNGGNDGVGDNIDEWPYFYPASFSSDNLITVMATNATDDPTSFSNYGKITTDIAAPGMNIPGLSSTSQTDVKTTYDGTSFAAPQVAGVAALLLAYCPGISPTEIKKAIMESADKDDGLTELTASGGRLNARAALEYCRAHELGDGSGGNGSEENSTPADPREVEAGGIHDQATCESKGYHWIACDGGYCTFTLSATETSGDCGGPMMPTFSCALQPDPQVGDPLTEKAAAAGIALLATVFCLAALKRRADRRLLR